MGGLCDWWEDDILARAHVHTRVCGVCTVDLCAFGKCARMFISRTPGTTRKSYRPEDKLPRLHLHQKLYLYSGWSYLLKGGCEDK